ncbi:hypothetical protein GCM10020220_114430 [Nonomuraea rubra]|uniref:ABC transporter permease subunit n=1 Tax=Nonomuraea rubra TaxID=46180 RepID=UPI0031F18FA4
MGRTKITVYTISGFCSALGGVLLSFYMLSGYGLHAVGMELDAIAAVVIGGTLLTGGSGLLPAGTVLGVLVAGADSDDHQFRRDPVVMVDPRSSSECCSSSSSCCSACSRPAQAADLRGSYLNVFCEVMSER